MDIAEQPGIFPAHLPQFPPDAVQAAQTESAAPDTGLKPITRLISEDRISRIVPETATKVQVSFSSVFTRRFLHDDYNFCAAKCSVARGGKVKALDEAFREAEEWFTRVTEWLATKNQVEFSIGYETVALEVPNALAGRLVRLLNQYDKLSSATLFAHIGRSISGAERDTQLDIASRRINIIHTLCIPDNDRFADDGSRLS
ncbi:hypothetical protein CNE_BB2p03060 (plasmid) [Cupriavidus necator N-1]|uniref:DUF1845 domain-containing protein n=1 Tax=Cupriavidus necator (strain ATCC 43291 / DSM 13513 / CCUG 52238 / LMG 8453 / N-1) TaxID=1042878 RepID=F8GZ10_CUPNN|nr:hypothetical protein [Cupriavidus necator]AEI83101.1 hypothetical protein CNE_BB2p03060 [Cupriavidus necator N-1]MDX6008510.1 hypothetical protein [Cupriavidus necator]